LVFTTQSSANFVYPIKKGDYMRVSTVYGSWAPVTNLKFIPLSL
jgi:hypothetical protein